MRRWWIRWLEYDSPADSRPITCPPNDAILAWWETGIAGDDSHVTMVAFVQAKTEAAAKKAIAKDWPGKRRRWSFVNEVDDMAWRPGDRFPLQQWSLERLAKTEGAAQ